MTAPTIERRHAEHPEPLPSVFAVRAELEANADSGTLSFFEAQVDAAIRHAADTGSFTQLGATLRSWLGIALQAKNPDLLSGLDINGRGALQQRLVSEWLADRSGASQS